MRAVRAADVDGTMRRTAGRHDGAGLSTSTNHGRAPGSPARMAGQSLP